MKGYSLSILTNTCVSFSGSAELKEKCYFSVLSGDGRTFCFICEGGYPVSSWTQCQDFKDYSNQKNCKLGKIEWNESYYEMKCLRCNFGYYLDLKKDECIEAKGSKVGCAVYEGNTCKECFYEVNDNPKYFMVDEEGKCELLE